MMRMNADVSGRCPIADSDERLVESASYFKELMIVSIEK